MQDADSKQESSERLRSPVVAYKREPSGQGRSEVGK